MQPVESLAEQHTRKISGTGSSEFFPRLESLRGIACLIVALCHCFLTFRLPRVFDWNLQEVGVQLFNGTGAVVLFFVLSGYVLELALRRDEAAFQNKAWKFWLRRLLRIYPAALCVTGLAAAYLWWLHEPVHPVLTDTWYRVWYNEPFTLGDFARSGLLMSGAANHIIWTLQVELLAAAVIPFAHWANRHIPERCRAVVLLALMALPFLDSCPLLLRYFYMFYLGMLCANLRTASVPAWWPRLAFKVIVPVAIMGWVLAGSRYLPHENALMLQTLCSALIICAITLTAASRHTWLDAKPLRMLGRVSYSFYLMHFLCLYVLTRLLLTRIPELQNHPLAALGSLIILSVGVAAILAWILYRVVEAPMIRLGKRLTHPSSNNKASSACG